MVSRARRSQVPREGTRQVEVQDYRHREKRKNNPSAGLATYNFKEVKKVTYSYDPHLDPQLVWAGKAEHTSFEVDTVSLHIHERISTQAILKSVQRKQAWRQERLFAEPDYGMDKQIEFYQHEMDWANRLILGDSLLVMNSLLERELMAGRVQMIYVDPPYGVAYNSNFQPLLTQRDVRDADDNSLTREPEQIKAYRDTWTLGVHSWLTYLRDRLQLCRELLHESGSIFLQINDLNLHLAKCLMNEIFGADNFIAAIVFTKTGGQAAQLLASVNDYILWYAKEKSRVKYRQLYLMKKAGEAGASKYDLVELPDGKRRRLTSDEQVDPTILPKGSKIYSTHDLRSQGSTESGSQAFEFQGRKYHPGQNMHWKTTLEGMERLAADGRIVVEGNLLRYVRYLDDFPVYPLNNIWTDTGGVQSRTDPKVYAVQTGTSTISRCMLMTTDPSDLVFDPTCGSGTTAYCAEKWGRRWITCDTSRVALSLARQRLLTAAFQFYKLASPEQGVYGGLLYETVPHVTLRSIAQKEPSSSEALYDRPLTETDKVRVSGPFTVEAIPIASGAPEDLSALPPSARGDDIARVGREQTRIEASDYVGALIRVLEKDGVTFPGGKKLVLENLRPLVSSGFLHAEGVFRQNGNSLRAALSFGSRYGPVTVRQVDEALRLSNRTGFDVLIFAGFAVDPEALAVIKKTPIPKLQVHFANISPDIIVGDLLKTTRGSQLFTVFGEPDILMEQRGQEYIVKLRGVDIYDPITGQIHQSDGREVPAWFLDEDYDGVTFRTSQAFFPKEATNRNPWDRLENAIHSVVDKDKMETFRGLESLPFQLGREKRIAVKVIDVRGNEVMVVKSLNDRAG